MGTRALEQIFTPSSVAIIGASDKPGSLGGAVLGNLIRCGFEGNIYPVNAQNYKTVHDIKAYNRISQLPKGVALAVICTPASTVDKLIAQITKAGIPAAVIMTGGTARIRSSLFTPSRSRLLAIQDKTKVRILGPDCLGVINPNHKFNASNVHVPIKSGSIAYTGQSGAIANAIADWAITRNVGFSHVLTLGHGQDITLSDVVDYLADNKTAKTLLLHLDDFTEGRNLLRSLRVASRNKLVIALKSNCFAQSPLAPDIHTPGLLNRDLLIDHSLQRAGVLRVNATNELFDCIETIQQKRQLQGDRLAIISNSRGGAILALDRLYEDDGKLAAFSTETQSSLNRYLPKYVTGNNPVLLDPELDSHQLETVARIILSDSNVDALLVIYTPGLGTDPEDNATKLVNLTKESNKTLFCSWMGDHSVLKAREVFNQNSIPNFDTPDNAIKAFMYMVSHMKTQEMMRETPASIEITVDYSKKIIKDLPRNDVIMPQLLWDLLSRYGISIADNHYSSKIEEISSFSDEIKSPWVIKIHHKDYLKPFAYGMNSLHRWRSVGLNINSKVQIHSEAERLNRELKIHFPSSAVLGYSIQSMYRALDNLQISLGIGRDSEVGPFIFFGGGGANTDILADRQVALPPLNETLARQLIERSHASQVLRERSKDYDDEIIILTRWLVAISQMSSQYPTISGLEINAVRTCNGEFLALGVAGMTSEAMPFTFKAYPSELEERIHSHYNQRFTLRPIKAEDEEALESFYKKLSPEALRFRFFNSRRNFNHAELTRFTQIDYDREMAFIALGDNEMAGVVRSWIDPDGISSEFSIVIGSDYIGHRLGYILMTKMINYLARDREVLRLTGSVLPNNQPMLKLARRLGFSEVENSKGGFIELVLNLNKPKYNWQEERLQSK